MPFEKEPLISLLEARKGMLFRIHSLPPGHLRTWLLRLGISEGSVVECYERLAGGTIVLKKNRQQVAVGRQLARQVKVLPMTEEAPHAA